MYEYNQKELEEGWGIEDTGECPICKSKRISIIRTYQVWEERNLKSNRLIEKDTNLSPYAIVFVQYKCRKCGWISISFDA